MDAERYKRLAHGLGNLGYRLLGEENWSACGKWPYISGEVRRRYLPARHSAGSSFGNDSRNGIAPTIAIARDADGYALGDLSSYLAIGWITVSESREIAERFARARGEDPRQLLWRQAGIEPVRPVPIALVLVAAHGGSLCYIR